VASASVNLGAARAAALVVAAWCWAQSLPPAHAGPGRSPGPSTVVEVHSPSVVLPRSLLTPELLYPIGKLDYRTVARMLDRAAEGALGMPHAADAWRHLAKPSDRVGVLFDTGDPPASLVLLDAVVSALVNAGVRPGNITVWAESEAALFAAGVLLQRGSEAVNTLGADAEGFRGGLSRVAVGTCDVIVNVARLRPDARVGLAASITNQLAAVPQEERERLLAGRTAVASPAARPTMATKCRLHLLDALQPNYEPGPLAQPPYWGCGSLLASVDCVALDCVGMDLLEAKRAEVRGEAWPLEPAPDYLRTAMVQYRLGQADRARITVLREELR
jgi:hypothetical protein